MENKQVKIITVRTLPISYFKLNDLSKREVSTNVTCKIILKKNLTDEMLTVNISVKCFRFFKSLIKTFTPVFKVHVFFVLSAKNNVVATLSVLLPFRHSVTFLLSGL